MLNQGSTKTTVVARAAFNAVGVGGSTFLLLWGATDDLKASSIAGGIAFFGALGFRGGEGLSDIKRDNAGNALPGDVGR